MDFEDNETVEKYILLLQKKSRNISISIGEIVHILSGKGQPLLLLFLSFPFCIPFEIPGLSIPFGLSISFIGLKIALGKYVWLPKRILAKTLAPLTLEKIINKVLMLLEKMRGWVYPRVSWLCLHPIFRFLNGFLICFLGILLALPLPAPLTNMITAWSIIFLALGLLKDDGIFILIGYFVSLFTFSYYTASILFIYFLNR